MSRPSGERHLERNDRSVIRLRQVIAGMPEGRWTQTLEGGWTIGILLAHMAFWDRFVRERWEHARRTHRIAPVAIDLGLADLVNDASVPGWALIPPRDAARMALAAAGETNATIAALGVNAVDAVVAAGWDSLLDRSIHRDEHIAALERHASGVEPG